LTFFVSQGNVWLVHFQGNAGGGRRLLMPLIQHETAMKSNQNKIIKIDPNRMSDLDADAVNEITSALRPLLADVFALYLKTKNFHWHMKGPHFRDYHHLLDKQSSQIFEMTDDIAERAIKLGGTTLHSISDIAKHQTSKDNNEESVPAHQMLAELCADNRDLTRHLREVHEICGNHNDVATTSLIESWIDETERRTWFLFEMSREKN
jgi:starvation-inducible DNA-binding protein